ncbi:MAG: coproporphyrinogen III oxidase [Methanoregula sp. PtaU1.Bin051]|nr:MAG: coproporphyrinogen III oxidase [Methanoregula sp. PtaU1.Bin051]
MQRQDTKNTWLETLSGKRVYIETYGCRYNFGDSEKLWEILKHHSCTRTATDEEADAIIINTCTVVGQTERRMLRRLSRFNGRDLYITGCLPDVQKGAILAICSPRFIPHTDIREQYRRIGTITPDPVAIIQISEGCNSTCTYCIARKARGPLKSAPLSEILGRVKAFAETGSVEIQLTAQDVSGWGRDHGETLPDLIRAIGELAGRFFVRVGMMNPATMLDILDDLVEAFSEGKIFKFIHVPVQSGSDRVLRLMGRGYQCEDFEQIVAAFRRKYPGITIATDMIVGFPGENEDDFSESLALLRRLQANKVNITRYSRRPSTMAFTLTDMPDGIKKERSRLMQACAEEIYHAIHARYTGNRVPFVVTEKIRSGSVLARTPSYLGIVLPVDMPYGTTGIAEIRQQTGYYLKGECVDVREKFQIAEK